MNKQSLILSILLFAPIFGVAQQIDEAFLKNLPTDLRADFEKQSQLTADERDQNYVNPETRIDNLENALESAERMLENISRDLEREESKNNQLERIGDKFFQTYQASFLPINEPNADPSYILDAGDQITLQLIGQKNIVSKIKIKRDGAINIPDIGDIIVAGLSLQEATELVKKQVSQAFIGVEAFVSLSELRDINVLVVGNARQPGMYTLSGASSALSLLYAAGGIDENGSYRDIIHKRNNKDLQTIDLYEILLKGNLTFSHQLRSGDVLVVNPRLSEVRISGAFANPGIYEVLPSENLSNLLALAGMQGSHVSNNLAIERYTNGSTQQIVLDRSSVDSFKVLDGDSVSLLGSRPQFNKTKLVTISGEVNVPGIYAIDDNTTLLELIRQAGSYTAQAYPAGGILLRESLKELETASKEKSYNELIRYLIASPNFSSTVSSSTGEGIITFLSLLKSYEPVGRTVTEFSLAKLNTNPSLNRVLQDGDQIHIPAYAPDVFIFGEVMNPGSVPYKEMANPHDYIAAAGNISRVADEDRILLISPSGEVRIITKQRFRIFQDNLMVLPGSTIYVPREVGKLDGINLASTLAPIVSSLALSIASLNSINN
jgi:protein involved in polysaccharide export with SLBB domain